MNQVVSQQTYNKKKELTRTHLYAANFLHVPTNGTCIFGRTPFWSTQSSIARHYNNHITHLRPIDNFINATIAGTEPITKANDERETAMDGDYTGAIVEVQDETGLEVGGMVRASALSFITRMLEPDPKDGFWD